MSSAARVLAVRTLSVKSKGVAIGIARNYSHVMRRLEPPDAHHFHAAQGWLGLGARADAWAELDAISPPNQRHPAVLDLRWTMHVDAREWDAALKVAGEMLAQSPGRPDSWLHHAYALRRATHGGLTQARAALEPAAKKFPKEPVIPYNLSCYACQLQQLEEARAWFRKALQAGKKSELKRMALADPDLEALWDEIRQL
jgi:tetratricopeptide (TPR) repeat protein